MQGRNKSRLRRLPCVPEGSVRAAPGRDYRRRYGAQECCGRYHPAGEKRRVHPSERGKKEGLYSPARAGSGRAVAECAVEKPPDYAVFLLLTTSAEKLLPTIRSRAVQLQLSPLTPGEALPELRRRFPDESEQNLSSALEQAEGYLGPACEALKDGLFSEQALGLANGFAARDTLALLQVLVPMEKYKREQVLPVLEQTRKLLSMALRARAGERAAFGPVQALLRGRTGAELLQAAELLQQAANDLNGNVGVGAVIGGLCVHLR